MLIYEGPITEGDDEAPPNPDAGETAAYYFTWPSLGRAKISEAPQRLASREPRYCQYDWIREPRPGRLH
ncbi:hypothetical protein GCM10009550_65940 [Actinocorallia libanotica]|uniref:Uncharacterized protein n=1 Tax=Actinocorallia libanotica TaxID=46162 RepID=A0ABN1RVU6_9ACTN